MSDGKAFWTWETVQLIHRQAALFPKGLRRPEPVEAGRIYFPASLGPNDAAFRIVTKDMIRQMDEGRKGFVEPLHPLDDLELPQTEWFFRPPYIRSYKGHREHFKATGKPSAGYLTHYNMGSGLYVCNPNRLFLGSLPWDYETEADRYWREVDKLDQTKAGRKADELVTHLLRTFYDEDRVQTWQRYRYFDLHFAPKKFDPAKIVSIRFQAEPHLGTFIVRHGGVEYGTRWGRFGDKLLTTTDTSFCLHPAEPYPSGDLIVTQLMFLLTEGLWHFMKTANW